MATHGMQTALTSTWIYSSGNFRAIEGGHHVEEQILHLVYQRTCIVGIVNCTVANRKPGWRFHRFAFLVLLMPRIDSLSRMPASVPRGLADIAIAPKFFGYP